MVWRLLSGWLRRWTAHPAHSFCRCKPKPAREVVLDIETTGLDPARNQIVCIGLLLAEGNSVVEKVVAGPNEKFLLCEFWDTLQPDDYLVGHNILNFDLPFIVTRSRISGVTVTRKFRIRSNSTTLAYDTMQVDSGWGKRRYRKLGALAKAYGLQGKNGSGKGVPKLAREGRWKKIENYCLGDVRLTWNVYQQMKNSDCAAVGEYAGFMGGDSIYDQRPRK